MTSKLIACAVTTGRAALNELSLLALPPPPCLFLSLGMSGECLCSNTKFRLATSIAQHETEDNSDVGVAMDWCSGASQATYHRIAPIKLIKPVSRCDFVKNGTQVAF